MESLADYYKYARELDNFHTIFYEFWKAGAPKFSEEIPTACVSFNREGRFLEFIFNPTFWDKLNDYDRLFVICHEMLHIILDHGVRSRDEQSKQISNIALDLVVNHMLVSDFGFRRESLSIEKDLCWIDTFFEEEDLKECKDRSYEFYLNKLKENATTVEVIGLDSIDDHEKSFSSKRGITQKEINEIKENISENLDNETKKKISKIIDKDKEEVGENDDKKAESKRAGTKSGSGWLQIKKVYKPKKKWESVIKKWTKFADKERYEEQWLRRDRRFENIDSSLFLPMQQEIEGVRSKIDVWFFQDTSGSCVNSAERFFQVAKTIPQERFNIKMHCFDTRVFETDLKSGKLYGFGGTSFSIIESYIKQNTVQKGIKYPSAIFVITDGYGDYVRPEYPERWHWFLIEESYSSRQHIPETSKIYTIGDFE